MAASLESIKSACARTSSGSTGKTGGAFLVRPGLLLSCEHVVGKIGSQVTALFYGETVPRGGTVVWSDPSPGSDCAAIRLDVTLAGRVPLELAASVPLRDAPWEAFGFPEAAGDGSTNLRGLVQDPNGRDLLNRTSLCLFSDNVRVGAFLQGLSGSPVISDGRVIGMLAQIIPKPGQITPAAEFGLVHARPSADLHRAVYEGLRSGPVRLIKTPAILEAAVSHRTSPIRESLQRSLRASLSRYQNRVGHSLPFIDRKRLNQSIQELLPQRGSNWIQVIAPSGTGKTAWSLQRALLLSDTRAVGWVAAKDVPYGERDPLAQAILQHCGSADIKFADILRELHHSGSLIYFIDGVEEVADWDQLKTILNVFQQGPLGPHTHLILLCREESLEELQIYIDDALPSQSRLVSQGNNSQPGKMKPVRLHLPPLGEYKALQLLESAGASPNQGMEVYVNLPEPYRGRPFFLLRALRLHVALPQAAEKEDHLGALLESYIDDVRQRLRTHGQTRSSIVIKRFVQDLALMAIVEPQARISREQAAMRPEARGEDGENSLLGRCIQAGIFTPLDEQWLGFGHALLLEYFAAQALVADPGRLTVQLEHLLKARVHILRSTLLRLAPMLSDSEPLLQFLSTRAPLLAAEVAAATKRYVSEPLHSQIVNSIDPLLKSRYPSDWGHALSLLGDIGGADAVKTAIGFFNSKTLSDLRPMLHIASVAFLKLEVQGAIEVILTHPEMRSNYYFPSIMHIISKCSAAFKGFLAQSARSRIPQTDREAWQYHPLLKMLAILKDNWLADYLDSQLSGRTLSHDENHALILLASEKAIEVYISNFDIDAQNTKKIKACHEEEENENTRETLDALRTDLYPKYPDILDNENAHLKEWVRTALESPILEHVKFGVSWAHLIADESFLPSLDSVARCHHDRWLTRSDLGHVIEKIFKQIAPRKIIDTYQNFPNLRKYVVKHAHACPGVETEDFLIGCLVDPLYRFDAIQSLGFLNCLKAAPKIHFYVYSDQDESDCFMARRTLVKLGYRPVILDIIIDLENAIEKNDTLAVDAGVHRLGEFDAAELIPLFCEVYHGSSSQRTRNTIIQKILWSKAENAQVLALDLIKSDEQISPSLIMAIGMPLVTTHKEGWIRDSEILQLDHVELFNYLVQSIQSAGLSAEALRACSAFNIPEAERFLEQIAAGETSVTPSPIPNPLSQTRPSWLRPLVAPQEQAQAILAKRGSTPHTRAIVLSTCRAQLLTDPDEMHWAQEKLGELPHLLVTMALRDHIRGGDSPESIVAAHLFIEGGYAGPADESLLRQLGDHADLAVADLAHRARAALCPELR